MGRKRDIPDPICNCEGKCFARSHGKCTILRDTYDPGKKCPFQAEKVDVYKGQLYPYISPTSYKVKGYMG